MEDKKIIKKSVVKDIISQNRQMRELLNSWPARELMMDFEKTWNEKRVLFLENNPPHNLKEEEI